MVLGDTSCCWWLSVALFSADGHEQQKVDGVVKNLLVLCSQPTYKVVPLGKRRVRGCTRLISQKIWDLLLFRPHSCVVAGSWLPVAGHKLL